MADNQFTFYPEFQETVALYRGIETIWVADGSEEKPGNEGYLYARFVNGKEQEIGPVFDYDKANQIYTDKTGQTLSYEKWIQFLLDAPETAIQVENLKDNVDSTKEQVDETAAVIGDNLTELNNTIAEVESGLNLQITYQNSDSRTEVPTADNWKDRPNPEVGQFTWTRVEFNWPGLIPSKTFYFVTGYKDPIASIGEIETQFINSDGESYNDFATDKQIENLFNTEQPGDADVGESES